MVDTLDVVRGRRIPCPPFGDKRGKKLSSVGVVNPARMQESTDPYARDGDLRIVLDLAADKCGVGMALKFLAYLEVGENGHY